MPVCPSVKVVMILSTCGDHRHEFVLPIDPPDDSPWVMSDILVAEMDLSREENIGRFLDFRLKGLPSLCFHPISRNLSCCFDPRLAILGTRLAMIEALDCELLGALFIGFTLIIGLPPCKRQNRPP